MKANYFTIFQWFLPYIDMNQPWVYMCSPFWSPLPPPSPSHPSGSSQCTGPERPVPCIEPGLAVCFTYDNTHTYILYLQAHSIPRNDFTFKASFLFNIRTLQYHSAVLHCRAHSPLSLPLAGETKRQNHSGFTQLGVISCLCQVPWVLLPEPLFRWWLGIWAASITDLSIIQNTGLPSCRVGRRGDWRSPGCF